MKSIVSIAIFLIAVVTCSFAAHVEGLSKKTDFKTMPPDQVQALLLNASAIKVNAPKNLISDHTTMELCNGRKYSWASREEMGEQSCVITATVSPQDDLNNANVLLRNMGALFRGCGLYAASDTETYGDDRSGYSCGLLGSLFFAIGNVPAARAAWDAPGCRSRDANGHPVDGCMAFIVGKWGTSYYPNLGGEVAWVGAFNNSRINAYSSDHAKLLSMAKEACTQDLDGASCYFLQTETGQQANWAAIESATHERHGDLKTYYAAEDAQREQESRDKDARFNSVMNALQSMPGASDPNAIINAANQQAAAVRAAGDAEQQSAAQRRAASQIAPAPSASSSQPTTAMSPATQPASNSNAATNSSSTASSNPPSNPPASGSCTTVNSAMSVTDQWRSGSGGFCSQEALAFVSNNTSQSVDCVVVFHKNGTYDTANGSLVTVAPGQRIGGEWGGLWSCGNDSNQVIFSCVPTAQNLATGCLAHVNWKDLIQ
ncbi:MAG: hypothetical protein WBQ85_02380 [Candidatus Sulfotelmatobacter sp.]